MSDDSSAGGSGRIPNAPGASSAISTRQPYDEIQSAATRFNDAYDRLPRLLASKRNSLAKAKTAQTLLREFEADTTKPDDVRSSVRTYFTELSLRHGHTASTTGERFDATLAESTKHCNFLARVPLLKSELARKYSLLARLKDASEAAPIEAAPIELTIPGLHLEALRDIIRARKVVKDEEALQQRHRATEPLSTNTVIDWCKRTERRATALSDAITAAEVLQTGLSSLVHFYPDEESLPGAGRTEGGE